MVLRDKLASLGLAAGLVLASSLAGFAQQPQTTPGQDRSGQEGGMRRGGPRPEGMGIMGILRDLNLTDEQKQNVKVILEKNMAATKPQRDEMRQLREKAQQGTLTPEERDRMQKLREDMMASEKSVRADVFAILTPEQRAQFEQKEKEMRERREQMRQNRPEGTRNPTR